MHKHMRTRTQTHTQIFSHTLCSSSDTLLSPGRPPCPQVLMLPYFPCWYTHTHTHILSPVPKAQAFNWQVHTAWNNRRGAKDSHTNALHVCVWMSVLEYVLFVYLGRGEGTGRRQGWGSPTGRPSVINTVFTPGVPASPLPLICPTDDLPSLMWNEAWSRVIYHPGWWERPGGQRHQPKGCYSGLKANDWTSTETCKVWKI